MDVWCGKDLDTTAKCPLCSETLKDPKTLPCLHSFCLLCLDNLARIEKRRLQDEISCPICQTSIPIPEANTFIDLPTSFHLDRFKEILTLSKESKRAKTCLTCNDGSTAISYCFVCEDFLCSTCDKVHRRLRATRDHRTILLQNELPDDLLQRPVMCTLEFHEEEGLKYFCQQCNECICDVCYMDEGHWQHEVVDIQQAAHEVKERLSKTLTKAEEEMIVCQDDIKVNDDILKSREQEIGAARRNVKAIVNELITSLKDHEEAVLTKMDDIHEQQQKSHAIKHQKLELFVTRLKSPVELGKCVLRRNADVEILKEQKAIIDRCKDLQNSKETEIFEFPFVNYIFHKEMCQSVQLSGPGKLIVSSTDPSRSTARILKSHAEVVVDSKAVILVCTRNSWGKRCYHENDQVEVKIKNPVGKELDMALEDEHNGRYKVYFTPKFVGQYDITINVNGQPLTNLPRSVKVTPHQYQIQYHEEEEISSWRSLFYAKNVHLPLDISISQVNGNIAILNECSAIELYDANGRYLCCFGKKNSTEVRAKRLKFPKSVTFSASGYIVVIDYDTITICTEEGIFLWYFTKHIKHPLSVSVTFDGCFIVCDRHDARIKVLSPDGEELLRCFGDPDLNGPPSFAIHHQDRFFVSYCEEHCVSVFNNEGTFLYSISTIGHGKKKLNGPLGLAVDKFNNLIVCDSNGSRLQVFTLEGKYVTTITGFGSPQFVAASKDGKLYVADKEKKCVHVLY